MSRDRIVAKPLVVLGLTMAAVISSGAPAAAAPASPGACHMMDANQQGIVGMRGASAQGFGNMIDVVLASLDAGCTP